MKIKKGDFVKLRNGKIYEVIFEGDTIPYVTCKPQNDRFDNVSIYNTGEFLKEQKSEFDAIEVMTEDTHPEYFI